MNVGKITSLFENDLNVINMGLESFSETLQEQGVQSTHVVWSPPAGGNPKLIDALDFLNSRKKDIDEATANHIFDYMEKFAGYGFNKSHAAAYALVAYQTAWLKAHYPAEFLAAVMSSEMQNTDNVVFLIDDCRHNDIEVLPPSVNMSIYQNILLMYNVYIQAVISNSVQLLQRKTHPPILQCLDIFKWVTWSL